MTDKSPSLPIRVLHAFRKPVTSDKSRTDDPAKQQKDTAVSYSLSHFLNGKWERMYNPDMLIKAKGARIYNKMLIDDQVQAAFNLKLNIIISRNMRFKPTGEGQEEIIEFFNRNINDLIQGTWLNALRSILMAKAYGFSVCEKIFRYAEVDGKARWVIDRIVPKPFDSFQFDVDTYGTLINIMQDIEGSGRSATKLDQTKFIYYVNKPEIDPIWGQSDLKSSYRPYWEKDITGKYWNIYLERIAGGFITATPGERAGNLQGPERTALEDAMKNINTLSGIVMPQGYEAEMHFNSETKAFIDRIQQADKQIGRGILIPNLLGFSEQGDVGSYSQSQTQLDIFMMLIKEDGDSLSEALNEQLFSQLAWWNFGVTDYPRAYFEEFTVEQKRLIADTWTKAQKDGSVTNTLKDELHTRELLLYPTFTEEELQEEKDKKAEMIPTTGVIIDDKRVKEPDGKDKKDKPTDKDDDSKKDDAKAKAPTTKDTKTSKQSDNGMVSINILPASGHTSGTVDSVSNVSVNHAEEDSQASQLIDSRVNYPVLQERLDDIEENFISGMVDGTDQALSELDAAMADMNGKVKKGTSFTAEQIKKNFTEAVTSKTKAMLHRGIRSSLKATYNMGWNTSYKATEKAARQYNAHDKFIKQIQKVGLLSERRICSVQQWTIAHFVDGIALDMADAWFKDQAFTITGDLTSDMIDGATGIMREGIQQNWSTTQMAKEMKDVLGNITGGTAKQDRARLNTIARTNMSTIFTQSQLAFYNDPDLNGFVEGLRYSAVLDNRTTEVCQRLDQVTYAINNPIWRFITPPNHFQCRSMLLPATVLDPWAESKKNDWEVMNSRRKDSDQVSRPNT